MQGLHGIGFTFQYVQYLEPLDFINGLALARLLSTVPWGVINVFIYLHPASSNDTPNIRNHGLREYLVDEPVVPHEPGVSHVLHTKI